MLYPDAMSLYLDAQCMKVTMALVKRFEDLRAGQAARRLVKETYAVTRREAFAQCNIAEGFESGTNGDFSRFLTYARASAAEVQSSS